MSSKFQSKYADKSNSIETFPHSELINNGSTEFSEKFHGINSNNSSADPFWVVSK